MQFNLRGEMFKMRSKKGDFNWRLAAIILAVLGAFVFIMFGTSIGHAATANIKNITAHLLPSGATGLG